MYACVVFTAHPDSPEAALSAGGGAGRVSFGSQTVHGVCLHPDWMFTVSLFCLYSFYMRDFMFYVSMLSIFFVLNFLEIIQISEKFNRAVKNSRLKQIYAHLLHICQPSNALYSVVRDIIRLMLFHMRKICLL